MPKGLLADYLVMGICLAGAAALPARLRSLWILRFAELARRRPTATLAALAALVIAIRIACLPFIPPPTPLIADEFSHLFLGQTLAAGRLSTPAHPMWPHFETLFVMQQPTYASPYPPVQGVFLALGLLLSGNPWVGVLLSMGAMCAAMVWMLRAYFTRFWALYGGLLAAAGYGALSYWTNGFWGGAGAAIGGALVFGALPRLAAKPRGRDGAALGTGLVVLANSRPYEGFLVGMVVLAGLAVLLLRADSVRREAALRPLVVLGLVMLLGAVLTGFYNWRVTGSPLRLPYQPYIEQYAATPVFLWQTPPQPPEYREPVLRNAHLSFQADYAAYGSPRGMAWESFNRIRRNFDFYFGPFWVVVLPALPEIARERRFRLPLLALAVCFAGVLVTVGFQAHYAAPCAPVFILLIVAAFRRVRLWSKAAGSVLLLAAPPAWLLAQGIRAEANRPVSSLHQRPAIRARLASMAGTHLVFVHYAPHHQLGQEWVYNEPDIDGAKVAWARNLGRERNREVMAYFPRRTVWVLEPDHPVVRLSRCESPCNFPD